jgi:hypothetical protein
MGIAAAFADAETKDRLLQRLSFAYGAVAPAS